MKRNVKSILKRNLPTILSILGVVGAAGVGISAAVAQHKVEEEKQKIIKVNSFLATPEDLQHTAPNKQELLKIYCKHYWPTALVFAATTGCIVGSNKMSQKQYKELLGAYTALGAGFAGYREAVVQRYGEEVDQELVEESFAIMTSESVVNPIFQNVPCEKLLFYEPISDIYFRAYERDVILAEYHLNRLFLMSGQVSVGDFLSFLGIEPTVESTKVGWNCSMGLFWIDVAHERGRRHNGEKCYDINFLFGPDENYEDDMEDYGVIEYQEPSRIC